MEELTRISRARVMRNAHYLYNHRYRWCRAIYNVRTFPEFLAHAWKEEKKEVALYQEVAEDKRKLEEMLVRLRAENKAMREGRYKRVNGEFIYYI